jgi:hypothetical protein
MRSHQGLRPFVCNECGAQFTMKNNFKRHVEEHAGQRYGTRGGMRIRLARINADPNPAGQSQCGSGFGWPKSMRIRIRLAKVNADPDPVGQNPCGYGSGWPKSMRIRIHNTSFNFKAYFPLEFASFRISYIPVDGSSILQFMSFS